MTLPITEEEKTRARHHLGYLNAQEITTFVLGTPSSVETQFIIEGAFGSLMPTALGKFRQLLTQLDELEERLMCAETSVNQVGNIQLNNQGADNQQEQTIKVYEWKRSALANLLGIEANPFDKRLGIYKPRRSLNVRVS